MQYWHREVAHSSRTPRTTRNSRAAALRSRCPACRRRAVRPGGFPMAGGRRGFPMSSPMKCHAVQTRLAGYLDDAVTGAASVEERIQIRGHLESCSACRAELECFRKLAVLLSRVPKSVPPADLALRIKVAAAQVQPAQTWRGRLRQIRD